MTKKHFDKVFKETVFEIIKASEHRDGIKDIPLRRQSYNDMIDSYQKEGLITEKQAQNWGHPKYLES